MSLILIPEALQRHVDTVIDDFLNNLSGSEELKVLHEYLETDGWNDIFEVSNNLIAINFDMFADHYLEDQELRSHVGVDDDKPLSDSDRLSFAREMMSYLATELHDCVTPSIVYCTIKDQNDRSVVIGGYTESHGQLGPETTWLPIVRSESEFFHQLRDKNLILIHEIDTISDDQILGSWRT